MFQFKEFNVYQENAAMKICSDACAFGSLISGNKVKNALDIGAGTGLLSLFVAQRINCNIDAIEINDKAIIDARKNFKKSQFKERINLIHEDFNSYSFDKKYELIFSNPPFYSKQLISQDIHRNQAKHGEFLSLNQLVEKSAKLLNDKGSFWMLINFLNEGEAIKLAQKNNLNVSKLIHIKNKPNSQVIRSIIEAKKNYNGDLERDECIFREEDSNEYHSSFKNLTANYYKIF